MENVTGIMFWEIALIFILNHILNVVVTQLFSRAQVGFAPE